jgi:uncharacterized protein (DUF1499 family)
MKVFMKIVIVGILFLVIAGTASLFYMGYKSREGSAPGLVQGQLSPCPGSPNCVSSEDGTPQGQSVEPLPADRWARIPDAVEALGGTIIQQESRYIAAEFTSAIFRFVDDVEFRLSDEAIHVRSASRVGHSDMGANRKRVDALREQLER